jgi:hypothetical protein
MTEREFETYARRASKILLELVVLQREIEFFVVGEDKIKLSLFLANFLEQFVTELRKNGNS